MKKIKIAVMVAVLALAMSGCQKTAAKETTAVSTEASAAETQEVETQEVETQEADAVNKEVKAFAEQIVKAVEAKDLDEIIKMSGFPVYVSVVETNKGAVESIEEFAEVEPDQLFTDSFVKDITSYDLKNLKKSEAGYVVSGGKSNVIFKDKEGGFEIVGINVK